MGSVAVYFDWRKCVLSAPLDPGARVVAVALHETLAGGRGRRALRSIAAETGLALETVARSVEALAAADFLRVEKGHGRVANLYTFTAPLELAERLAHTIELDEPEESFVLTTSTKVPPASRARVPFQKEPVPSTVEEPLENGKVLKYCSPKTKTPKPRARNPVWDALDDAFGPVYNDAERSRRTRAVKLIKQSLAAASPDALADYPTCKELVLDRARRCANLWRGGRPTDVALASTWSTWGPPPGEIDYGPKVNVPGQFGV